MENARLVLLLLVVARITFNPVLDPRGRTDRGGGAHQVGMELQQLEKLQDNKIAGPGFGRWEPTGQKAVELDYKLKRRS